MRVLVTGGAGFIGSHLAERHLSSGDSVAIIDDLSTGSRDNVPIGAAFYAEDIVDGVPTGKWDVIYHCAASYADKQAWERDARTNVSGTIAVVREAQRSGAHLVYFQTSLCYGLRPMSPIPVDAPLDPVGSYAVSKTAGEAYIRDSGVPHLSFRLANIYGPRNLSGPPPQFFKRLSAGEECIAVDTRRDFVYVDDLVGLAVNAATIRAEGTYHVASGSDLSIESVHRAVAAAMGVAPNVRHVARGADDAETILLDPSHTRQAFGWQATTPFEEGIERAVAWYAKHGVRRTYTHLAQKG